MPVHPCTKGSRLLCGGIRVPLDYSSAASPRIHIGFQWLPATRSRDGHGPGRGGRPGLLVDGLGLAVPRDGGPAAADAQPAAGQPARHRQLDAGELPGPGARRAEAVRPAVQPAGGGLRRQLNHTWRYRNGGGWVHASDLFNTANSARDVAGVVARAAGGPGGSVRRLLRQLVRPGLRVALSAASCGR